MIRKYANLFLFLFVIVFLIMLPIVFKDSYLPQSHTPWQLQPFGADSLSSLYKSDYQIIGDEALINYLGDSVKTTVVVLVEGWGVPRDESVLKQEFSLLKDGRPQYALHKRAHNYTSFAEINELKNGFANGIFIYGANSEKCAKKKETLNRYFYRIECYEMEKDLEMVEVLDSILSKRTWMRIAWTTRQTSEVDKKNVLQILKAVSDISGKYRDVQFIIQGTHRPLLESPKDRAKYIKSWVPAVFLNAL